MRACGDAVGGVVVVFIAHTISHCIIMEHLTQKLMLLISFILFSTKDRQDIFDISNECNNQ